MQKQSRSFVLKKKVESHQQGDGGYGTGVRSSQEQRYSCIRGTDYRLYHSSLHCRGPSGRLHLWSGPRDRQPWRRRDVVTTVTAVPSSTAHRRSFLWGDARGDRWPRVIYRNTFTPGDAEWENVGEAGVDGAEEKRHLRWWRQDDRSALESICIKRVKKHPARDSVPLPLSTHMHTLPQSLCSVQNVW